MTHSGLLVGMCLLLLCLTSCGPGLPAPRLGTYLDSPASQPETVEAGRFPSSPIGLAIVMADQEEGEDSALSPQGLEFVVQLARVRVEDAIPVRVSTVVPAEEVVAARHARLPVTALAAAHGVEWLALVVLSRVEIEEPQPFAMDGNRGGGGAMGTLPGILTSVYALAELALVEGQSGRPAWRGEGRAVASLEQLTSGLESNAFPAIYRQGGQQRIAAPRGPVQARDALRSLVYEEALYQAAHALQQSWKAGGAK